MTPPVPTPTLSPWQWIWPASLAVGISVASGQSKVAAPDWDFIAVDKIAHFAVFGLLATLVFRMWPRTWRHAALAVVLVSAYGAADEWHQSFTPGRLVEVADWVTDTVGATVAVGLYRGWPGYRRLLERSLRTRRPASPGASCVEAPLA